MEMCSVTECEFNQPFSICEEIAEFLGESIEQWETNCFQGDDCYLNCVWRLEREGKWLIE